MLYFGDTFLSDFYILCIYVVNNILLRKFYMSGKDLVKWKLQVIFIYYSSYADRNNFKLLKQQNYRRFLIDS